MRDRRVEYSSVAKTAVRNQPDADAQSKVKLQENENCCKLHLRFGFMHIHMRQIADYPLLFILQGSCILMCWLQVWSFDLCQNEQEEISSCLKSQLTCSNFGEKKALSLQYLRQEAESVPRRLM